MPLERVSLQQEFYVNTIDSYKKPRVLIITKTMLHHFVEYELCKEYKMTVI